MAVNPSLLTDLAVWVIVESVRHPASFLSIARWCGLNDGQRVTLWIRHLTLSHNRASSSACMGFAFLTALYLVISLGRHHGTRSKCTSRLEWGMEKGVLANRMSKHDNTIAFICEWMKIVMLLVCCWFSARLLFGCTCAVKFKWRTCRHLTGLTFRFPDCVKLGGS